jgi:hypothetical protein
VNDEDFEQMIAEAATFIWNAVQQDFDVTLSLPRVTLRAREHEAASPLSSARSRCSNRCTSPCIRCSSATPCCSRRTGGRRVTRAQRSRELETLLLGMFAAVPLYFTYAISVVALMLFHIFMTAIVVRVSTGRSPELIPARLMRWIAILYVPFYILDAAFVSRSAIAASTHLVLFIAAYQPIEASHHATTRARGSSPRR